MNGEWEPDFLFSCGEEEHDEFEDLDTLYIEGEAQEYRINEEENEYRVDLSDHLLMALGVKDDELEELDDFACSLAKRETKCEDILAALDAMALGILNRWKKEDHQL